MKKKNPNSYLCKIKMQLFGWIPILLNQNVWLLHIYITENYEDPINSEQMHTKVLIFNVYHIPDTHNSNQLTVNSTLDVQPPEGTAPVNLFPWYGLCACELRYLNIHRVMRCDMHLFNPRLLIAKRIMSVRSASLWVQWIASCRRLELINIRFVRVFGTRKA